MFVFDQIFAVDEANPQNVARNSSVLLYQIGDATKTPVTITTPGGDPIPNPVIVNENGFGPIPAHETLDSLAWEGAGFGGVMRSYDGMKNVAVAAQAAAEAAAAEAASAGASAAAEAASALAGAVSDAEAAQTAAESAAGLVGAPADTAMAAAANNSGSQFRGALNATILTQTTGKLDKAVAADAAFVKSASMPVQPYTASRTITTLVDPVAATYGLTWTANPDIEFFDGLYWVAFDGNRTGGSIEGAAGQRINVMSSPDCVTWTDRGQFTSVTDDFHFQPNLKVINGVLHMYWSHNTSGFLSTLASSSASWVTKRFEWKGNVPVLTTTINGAAESGNTIAAVVDGYTDFALFFASKPLILDDGTICVPATFRSNVIDTDAPATAPTFFRGVKRNFAMLSKDNGATWSMSQTIPWSSASFAAGSWEPFPVQDKHGVIRMFSRNNRTTVADTDAQLVATSYNGGKTFTPAVPTKLQVPVSRGQASRVSTSRWMMAHCDAANNKTTDVTKSGGTRMNGNLFVSRNGADNFVAGIPFSDLVYNVVYPQFIVKNSIAYVVFSEDRGNKRYLKLSVVPVTLLDTVAYCLPRRSTGASAHAPTYRADTPAGWLFDGVSSVVAPNTLSSTDLSMTLLTTPDTTVDGTLVDLRQTVGGVQRGALTFRSTLFAIGSLTFTPAIPFNVGEGTFFSLRLAGSTGKVSMSVLNGQTTLSTSDGYVRSLRMTALPADGDTVVLNGVTFTFKTTATPSSNEIQIGATKTATVDNLVARLSANSLQGYNYTYDSTVSVLFVAKTNWTTFTVTGGTAMTADTNTAFFDAAAAPTIGYKGPITSTIQGFQGLMRDVRIYKTLLTDNELKYVYNEHASEDGYTPFAGATAPAAPWLKFDKDSTSATFPSLTAPRPAVDFPTDTALGRTVMRFSGETSAGQELPYTKTAVLIRFKLGALPTGSEKYTIATFGTVDAPIRLQIEAAAPTQLRVNGGNAGTIPVDALQWNYVEAVVTDTSVTIFGTTYTISSRRMYLGQAYPASNIDATKTISYDTAEMQVTEVK